MTPSRHSTTRTGVILLVTATLIVSVGDALAKWLAHTYSTSQITFVRSTIGLAMILGFTLVTGRLRDLRTQRLPWHMLRSALVLVVMFAIYYALAHLPLVEIEAISHAAPFFVAVLAPLILREHVTRHHWWAIAIGFAGVLTILRPDPDHFHIAHLYMFGCAAGYAILILLARKLSSTETILAINFYIYPPIVLVTALLARTAWTPPTPADWVIFALFGFCNTIATLLFIAGVRYVEATVAATMDYLTLLWVSVIGLVVWDEVADPVSACGIGLIVAGGIYIVRHTARRVDESILQTPDK